MANYSQLLGQLFGKMFTVRTPLLRKAPAFQQQGFCNKPTTLDAETLTIVAFVGCRFDQFIEVMKARVPQLQYTQIYYQAGNSLDKEIGASVTKDLYLIVISVVLFVAIALLFMSR